MKYRKLDRYFLKLYIEAAGMLPDRLPALILCCFCPTVLCFDVVYKQGKLQFGTVVDPRFQRGAMKHESGEKDKSKLEVTFTCGKHQEEDGDLAVYSQHVNIVAPNKPIKVVIKAIEQRN